MLTCPRCDRALGGLQRAAWECDRCGGRAVMFPFLRDRLSAPRLRPLQRAFVGASLTSPLRCPSCRHDMLGAEMNGVAIDVCRRCQLVWFDRGEAPEPDRSPPRPHLRPSRVPLSEDEDLEEIWRLLGLNRNLPVELTGSGELAFGNIPFATAALTLLIIVVGFLQMSHPAWIRHFGFLATSPFRDSGITLLTHVFLHGGAWHLAGNAYFLVMLGDNVEEAAGRAGLLILTFLGAVWGALLYALSEPFRAAPLVGASAGISALLAYYGLRFPTARIGWYSMNLPAWGFVGLWALYQISYAQWLTEPGVVEVSGAAHLGGAAVGVAFFAVQRRMSPWTSEEKPPS